MMIKDVTKFVTHKCITTLAKAKAAHAL